jgi:hypothetical protein
VSALPIVFGGLQILSSVYSLFSVTPMEHLLEMYAPIAIDRNLTPAQRVARGEGLLFAASEIEHGRRTINAVGSFLVAAICAGFAIGIGLDTNDFPTPDNVLLATSLGGLAITEIVSGIGSLWWERGTAEVAWDQWHAMHEPVTVQTSRIQLRPTFAAIRGGGTGGLSLRF